jgi:hypothetical protein
MNSPRNKEQKIQVLFSEIVHYSIGVVLPINAPKESESLKQWLDEDINDNLGMSPRWLCLVEKQVPKWREQAEIANREFHGYLTETENKEEN